MVSVLLAGIVALNVVSLSLGASQGKIAQQTLTLEQENSALRARLAERLSNDRVRSAAVALGMAVPAPEEISYRDATPRALQLTAQRLASGFSLGGVVAETPTATVVTPVSEAAPVEPEPVSAPAETTTAPTTTTTTTTEPAPSTAVTTGATGGGVSPG